MDVMLDTCGLLSLSGLAKKKLSSRARKSIRSADEVFISSCSFFEIAIKHKKGALDLGVFSAADQLWKDAVSAYDLSVLPVTAGDFWVSVNLPDHHQDPFDRIIIGQSLERKLSVITFDSLFSPYGVKTLF